MNVGLVGYGYWGKKVYRNLIAIIPPSNAYICDLDGSVFENIENTENLFTEFDDNFLAKIDALIICTPVKSHYEIAKIALQAGKHVLIEKPATNSLAQYTELVNIAQNKELVICTDHTFMFASEIEKSLELVNKNDFGKLNEYVSVRSIFGKINRDVNVIWDLATHDFSILYLLKPILPYSIQVNAIKGKSNLIETAYIFITYQDGFTAHISCSWTSPKKERMVVLKGEKQQLIIDSNQLFLFKNETEINTNQPNILNSRDTQPTTIEYIESETLGLVIRSFLESFKIENKSKINIESTIFVLKILEVCDLSIKNNGQVILFDNL